MGDVFRRTVAAAGVLTSVSGQGLPPHGDVKW
jgi:hypothetical protein